MHSKMYAKINKYYEDGLWSLRMVRDAVAKGKITEEEYLEITGEEYAE